MKFKHVLASCALAMVTALGFVAGLSGKQEAKEAKADDYSKMFSVVVDMGSLANISGFNNPQVHYYGTGVDARWGLHKLSGELGNNLYTANVPLTVSQTVEHVQFLFMEYDAEKWSNVADVTVSANKAYNFSYSGSWTGNNWDMSYSDNWELRVQYYPPVGEGITESFVRDLENQTWKATIEIPEDKWGENSLCQICFGGWNRGAIRNEWASLYTNDFSLNSFAFKEPGKYDIIIENNFEDGGVISMYKYGEEDSYIYYVSDSASNTANKIYSFAGSNQFGDFPGTSMSSFDVTGVLHFQGNEYKFYKIPVKIGYPVGDLKFMFAYDNNNKSAARFFVPGAAYWWSGEANADAGAALDYLVAAEGFRNAVEASGDIKDYSVCGISQSDAQGLVDMYNALGDGVAAIYVDSTYVKTYDPKDPSQETWISYYDVEQQLVKIASGEASSNSYHYDINAEENGTLVILIISITSVLAFTAVLLLKKKRQ